MIIGYVIKLVSIISGWMQFKNMYA